MTALADTDVPVPTTYAHCADDDGARRAVLRDGAGRRDAVPLGRPARAARPGADRRDRRPDGRRAGRAARRRPGRGRARRVRPARRASSSARCGGGASSSRARRPASTPTPTSCTGRLTEQVPAEDAGTCVGIVHGDYRLDNLLSVADDQIRRGRRLGDGDARRHPHRPGAAAGLRPARPRSPAAPWSPTWPRRRATRRPTSSSRGTPRPAAATSATWASTSALAYFKLAVILEGIHYRFLQGQTVGEGFDPIGDGFDPLIAAGLDATRRAEKN